MSSGSPVKGVAMAVVGMLLGVVGTDPNSGISRFTYGVTDLADGIQLVALALGLFGVTEFLRNVNRLKVTGSASIAVRDMFPSWSELREAFWPIVRGTGIGTLFGRDARHRADDHHVHRLRAREEDREESVRVRHGAIAGVAGPEASSHSKTQSTLSPR